MVKTPPIIKAAGSAPWTALRVNPVLAQHHGQLTVNQSLTLGHVHIKPDAVTKR